MVSQPAGVFQTPVPAVPDRAPVSARLAAIDVFRGFVMTLMLAEVLHLSGLGRAFPGNPLAGFIAFNTSHVEWAGCSLHDLIQPGFSFLVGAALPFSIASRLARNQSYAKMFGHAAWRAFVLVALGIILRSLNRPQTYFTFEDTLTQIGLGYLFLFALGFASVRVQVGALIAILVGYWAAFALYPAPGPGFNYPAVGVPADWPHLYNGFASHWNKNSNFAWAFDTWFMNLFPREKPFLFNGGGYSTLSFIPTLGTMLIGLMAGEWLRSARSVVEKLRGLLIAGAGLLAIALLWHWSGTGPFVKRIWTPSFTLGSGGLVLLMLGAIFYITEQKQWRKWAFPLIVVGSNSIVAYLLSWVMEAGIIAALNRHLGRNFFLAFGPAIEPLFRGAFVLAIFWLILYWMYRRKIFVRI